MTINDRPSGAPPDAIEDVADADAERTSASVVDVSASSQAFFGEVMTLAIEDHGIDTSRESEIYLVSLVSDHALHPGGLGDLSQPFGLRLAKALHTHGGERFERLRSLGDDVLFLSGFFSDHLRRRGVELGYAADLGQVAYGNIATMLRRHAADGPPVFDELAVKFSGFVELLQHVADILAARAARDDQAIVELYERWSRSRSAVLADALLQLGVMPSRGNTELN